MSYVTKATKGAFSFLHPFIIYATPYSINKVDSVANISSSKDSMEYFVVHLEEMARGGGEGGGLINVPQILHLCA